MERNQSRLVYYFEINCKSERRFTILLTRTVNPYHRIIYIDGLLWAFLLGLYNPIPIRFDRQQNRLRNGQFRPTMPSQDILTSHQGLQKVIGGSLQLNYNASGGGNVIHYTTHQLMTEQEKIINKERQNGNSTEESNQMKHYVKMLQNTGPKN